MKRRQIAWLLVKDLFLRNRLLTLFWLFESVMIVGAEYSSTFGEYGVIARIGSPAMSMVPLLMMGLYQGRGARVYRVLPIGSEAYCKWIWGLFLVVPVSLYVVFALAVLAIFKGILPLSLQSPLFILPGICLTLEASVMFVLILELSTSILRVLAYFVLLFALECSTFFFPPRTLTAVAWTLVPVFIPLGWLSYRWLPRLIDFYFLPMAASRRRPKKLTDIVKKVLFGIFAAMAIPLGLSVIALGPLVTDSPYMGFFSMECMTALWCWILILAGLYRLEQLRGIRVLPLSRLRVLLWVLCLPLVLGGSLTAVSSVLACLSEMRHILPGLYVQFLFALALALSVLSLQAWLRLHPVILFLFVGFITIPLAQMEADTGFSLSSWPVTTGVLSVAASFVSIAGLFWLIGNSSRPYTMSQGFGRRTR